MSTQQKVIYLFGSFRLDPRERQLCCNGTVVRLQRKAFDVLLVLVQSSGQLVTKDELMGKVWCGSVVEEANLSVHVSTLRKALHEHSGDGKYIESVPKFGYRFVCEVTELIDGSTSQSSALSAISTPEAPLSSDNQTGTPRGAPKWLIRAAIMFTIFSLLFWVKTMMPGATQLPTSMFVSPPEETAVAIAISPDGKFVAYSVSEKGQNSLWIHETDGEESRQLVPPEQSEVWGIVFSPRENYIYYNRGPWDDAVLYRVKIFNGSYPEKVRVAVNSPIAVSPDGTQIAYIENWHSSGESRLTLANADGSDPHTIAMRKQPSYFQYLAGPTWSSDGETLAVIVDNGAANVSSLVGFNVGHGTENVLPAPANWQIYRDLEWLPDGSGLIVSVRVNSPTAPGQVWELLYPSGKAKRITNDRNDYETVSLAKLRQSLVTQADSNIWLVPDVHNPTGLRQLRLREDAGR
jgi:DNA-binding winged helix-turn-helix (wHTH) protein